MHCGSALSAFVVGSANTVAFEPRCIRARRVAIPAVCLPVRLGRAPCSRSATQLPIRYRLRGAYHFVGLTAVLALIVAACSAPATSPTALTMARARWAENAPTAYSVTIHRSCECLPEMSGPVVVEVRNKIVESRRYVRSGAAVAPTYDELFPTIDGLFAIIDAAVRDGTRPLDVRYDPTRGYPTRIVLGDPAMDNPVYSVSELRPQ